MVKKLTKKSWMLVALVLGACFLGGCEPEFNFAGERAQPDAVSPQSEWVVTGTPGVFRGLNRLHDGNLQTFAISTSQYRNAMITIDMGRPCLFNLIAIPHGHREYGFARRISVSTSNDGRNFKPIYTGIGTKKVTYLPLMTPITARYIRLQAIMPGKEPWALADIYVQ